MLLFKCVFLTRYDNRAQYAILAVALGYSGFAAAYGEDVWFFLIVLLGAAAKGVDLRAALKVYLITAAVGRGRRAAAARVHRASSVQLERP